MSPLLFAAAFAAVPLATLDVPKGARWELGEEKDPDGVPRTVATRPYGLPPVFVLATAPALQPDLSAVDPAAAVELFGKSFGELEGFAFTHRLDPRLGDILIGRGKGRMNPKDPKLDAVMVLFETEAGVGMLGGFALAGRGNIEAATEEMLGYVKVAKPPLPPEAFTTGSLSTDLYTLPLPDGWRRVTDAELPHTWTNPTGQYTYDNGFLALPLEESLAPAHFLSCVTDTTDKSPADIVNPERADIYAQNYLVRTAAMINGTRFSHQEGNRIVTTTVIGDSDVRVSEEESAGLQEITIGDRPAYVWNTFGTKAGEAVDVVTLYTSFDSTQIHCTYVGKPETGEAMAERFGAFRVLNGEAHPMKRSLAAEYYDWWPYTDPYRQLYWAPLLFLILVMGLVIREIRANA